MTLLRVIAHIKCRIRAEKISKTHKLGQTDTHTDAHKSLASLWSLAANNVKLSPPLCFPQSFVFAEVVTSVTPLDFLSSSDRLTAGANRTNNDDLCRALLRGRAFRVQSSDWVKVTAKVLMGA